MKTQMTVLFLTLASFSGIAGKQPRVLSTDEMRDAYNVSVQCILAQLKAPDSAYYQTIDEARFSSGMQQRIDVRLDVTAQNSFGAMLRVHWTCGVWPSKENGRYHVWCREN